MIISDTVLKACVAGLENIAKMLASVAEASKQEAPARQEPEEEPRKLRQSERPGLDMNDLRRAADRERTSKRLPRSPEEARGLGRWGY